MRILLVEPDFEDNGALRVSLDRATRWAELGADVTVLVVSNYSDGPSVPLPRGIRFIVANQKLMGARWSLPNALRHGLGAALAADVIVAGREIASGLLMGAMLAKVARRPLAVTVHSHVASAVSYYGSDRHRRNVHICLKAAAMLVPVSKGLIPGLVDLGVRPSRIRVVENGIDTNRLLSQSAEPPAVNPGPEPTILGLGRLAHEKGFDLLIRAHARALRAGAPPHRLLIVGEGPDRELLTSLVANLGVAGSVTFAGFLPNPYPVLAACDLLVFPSRWEGFGLSLAEALALGVPTIAADCLSGPAEILAGGRFGALVPVGDEAALANAIADHLSNPEPLRTATVGGLEHVKANLDADLKAKLHLQYLEELARQVTYQQLRHPRPSLGLSK